MPGLCCFFCWISRAAPYTVVMREAATSTIAASMSDGTAWRELFRCEDLRLARAVATTIAAMEFDVRLSSINPAAWESGTDRRQGCEAGASCDRHIPGPHVIEVPVEAWPQLVDVLGEIVDEQREFDEMLELRDERHRVRLVVVLSVTTAAQALIIWRLLEG